MTPISQFLRDNGLKQVQLARYLGITEASVSKLANGISRPSQQTLNKILGNDQGWNTAALSQPQPRRSRREDDAYVSQLLREIDRLREENQELRREKSEYWEVIKMLSKQG